MSPSAAGRKAVKIRVDSGDGFTGDDGDGDITGDKIFTGDITGDKIVTGEAFFTGEIDIIGQKWPYFSLQGTRKSQKCPFTLVLGPDGPLSRVSSKSDIAHHR